MERELLEKVVKELSALLPDARVDKVTEAVGGGICLHLHRQRSRLYLLLAPDRVHPRIHLLSRRPVAAPVPPPLVLFLRKRVIGARIDGLRTVNDDRVVEIALTGRRGEVKVICELTGRSANILLLDNDGSILFVLRPGFPDGNGQRMLVPGAAYEPPRSGRGFPPSGETALPAEAFKGNEGTAANRAAETLAEEQLEQREGSVFRRELRKAAARALGKTERRIAAIGGDLRKAEGAEEYQAAGAAILANLGVLRKGMERAELPGGEGGTIVVTLDPARTPAENADAWFRKAKKARSSQARIRDRLEDARKDADILRRAAENIEAADGRDALQQIRDGLVRHGLLRREQQRHPAGESEPLTAVRIVRFGEWEILVGRNAVGNDRITGKIARSDDLWLHAESMPGSHVLVRNPARRDIPQEVLLRAASLAAYFSRGREAVKVPVTFTRARFVRKPKGAKPGLAVLGQRETVMVAPQPP